MELLSIDIAPKQAVSGEWALAQADRIDPVLNGSYKTRPAEPEE